jgi:glycerol kinase
MAIVAIDQGTSGTKALVIGETGEVLSRGYAHLDLQHGAPGVSECAAEDLWQSIVKAVKQALAGTTEKITAVGLANQGESILTWDKSNGHPLSQVIIWQDSRSASLCDERRSHSDFILAKSGLALDPYFVAPKMVWLRERVSSGVITTTDTWIIARLTGKFVTDVATASRTLLFDLHTRTWSTELADIWGLDTADLPELINNDVVIGEICHPDIEELRGVVLAGAMVDQPAALLAENCFALGQAKCTYGTGAFLLTNIGSAPKISAHGLATSLAWNIRGNSAYYLDGQVFTAATAVQWLVDNDLLASAEAIDSLPDARGVMAAPGFAGYGAPLWKPHATASIAGLTLSHVKGEIARAMVDGIAAQVADLLGAIAADGVAVKELRVDGGLTQSHTLMQMQADLAQVNIEVYPHPDATAMGVANLAAMATNSALNLGDFASTWKPVERYSPKWSVDRAESYLTKWRTLPANAMESAHE